MEQDLTFSPSQLLKKRLDSILQREMVPGGEVYLQKVLDVTEVLAQEDELIRPKDIQRHPGGLIRLMNIPTIIVPDLHARMDFFLHIMDFKLHGEKTVAEELSDRTLQVLCVGDGFHAEGRGALRWRSAFQEYLGSYRKRENMDEEMRESLGLMEMVMEAKIMFPDVFHFLKGNHENITNEDGEGNYPFGKFAYEGEMVAEYVRKFYGEEFIGSYSVFEKNLPLLAVGSHFLVSHAEPVKYFPEEKVINYRANPDVIYGLTWTADDQAEEGSVEQMLSSYLPDNLEGTFYFGGHRTIMGLYNLRADGRYIQIHNPEREPIAVTRPGCLFNPDTDILEL